MKKREPENAGNRYHLLVAGISVTLLVATQQPMFAVVALKALADYQDSKKSKQ